VTASRQAWMSGASSGSHSSRRGPQAGRRNRRAGGRSENRAAAVSSSAIRGACTRASDASSCCWVAAFSADQLGDLCPQLVLKLGSCRADMQRSPNCSRRGRSSAAQHGCSAPDRKLRSTKRHQLGGAGTCRFQPDGRGAIPSPATADPAERRSTRARSRELRVL